MCRDVDDTITELPPPELIPLADAARRLGMHPGTAYRLRREGKFPVPVLLVGSVFRVRRSELDAFILGETVAS